jgi:hypothetical protein
MTGKSKLAYYMELASNGTASDVDLIMENLIDEITFVDSRFIDYALSLVESSEGVDRITHYLFEGTQIQRNYCTLFFTGGAKKATGRRLKKPTTWG